MIRGGAVVVPVASVASAVRFYIETLGMKLVEERPVESIIDAGEGFLLALRASTEKLRGGVELHAKVPLAEAIAIYENRGVVFDASGRFEDPDGNAFTLV